MSEENGIEIKLSADTNEVQGALEQAGEKVKELNDVINESFAEMAGKVKDAFDQVGETLEGGGKAGEEACSSVGESVQGVVSSLNSLFEVVSGDSEAKVGELVESIKSFSEACGEASSGEAGNLSEGVRRSGDAAQAAKTQMSTMTQTVVTMKTEFESTRTTANSTSEQMRAVGVSAQSARGQITGAGDAAQLASSQLATMSRASQSSSTELSSIQTVATSVRTEITSTASGVRNAGSQLGETGSAAGGVSSALKLVGGQFAAFAQMAVAAYQAMKQFADMSAKMTKESVDLGHTLGISTTEASTLKFAISSLDGDSSSYVKSVENINSALHENESSLKGMGIHTRDSTGHLRDAKDVLVDAIAVINQHKEGLDRNAVCQKLLGISINEADSLMQLNNETLKKAREQQESLGLVVGKENVEAQEKYQESMKNMDAVTQGLQKTIGDVVMPVVTEMGDWFSSIGPAAVTVTRGAVGGLTAAFWYLRNGVVTVWEVCVAANKSMSEIFVALGESFSKALRGDFSGAKSALQSHCNSINQVWDEAMKKMVESSQKTNSEIEKVFLPTVTPTDKPNTKGKKQKVSGKGEGGKSAQTGDSLKQIKLEEEVENKKFELKLITEEKLLEKKEEFANRSYAIELKALMQEAALYGEKTDAHKSALAKIMLLEISHKQELEAIAGRKKQPDDKGEDSKATEAEANALREVQIDESIAKIQLENKIIDQKKMLELEEQFENRRYEIKLKGLKERMALAAKDSNQAEADKLSKEVEQLELGHQQKLKAIKVQGSNDSGKFLTTAMKDLEKNLGNVWQSHIDKMIKGDFKWKNAYKDTVSAVRSWFVSNVKKMAVEWLLGEESKSGATLAGIATREAAELAASAKSVAIWAASAIKNITTSAWEAMAGAWKAMVGVPYVGPVLAIAASAAAFSGVIALASNVKSASGGYDIPAGVNPMTQLHEQEMVLPAHIANPLRSMIATGGDGGGGGGDTHVHISAVDAKSVKRLLRDNGRVITDAVKGAVKDGYRA
ncbi:hypothetical protein [Uliginosibacterium gangwonense]|uniref:hypothetical protein n=1 Tax=Uliginosibacterium gangwonense TaxID=392736 RepID=UPI0003679D8C|nr:hypothetical protein [Uliginosibacterium gangwonense]